MIIMLFVVHRVQYALCQRPTVDPAYRWIPTRMARSVFQSSSRGSRKTRNRYGSSDVRGGITPSALHNVPNSCVGSPFFCVITFCLVMTHRFIFCIPVSRGSYQYAFALMPHNCLSHFALFCFARILRMCSTTCTRGIQKRAGRNPNQKSRTDTIAAV